MDFFDLIHQRESCRDYAQTPVDTALLKKCVDAACLAPSACNSQPWFFTVVNRPDLSAQVATCTQEFGMNKFTDNTPAFIIINEEKANLSAKLGGIVKSQEYAPIDIGLATAQLCLAATELGLSTCIIGAFKESKLKKLLNIDKTKRIRLVIAVGYAAKEGVREKRRKPSEDTTAYIE